MTRIALALLLAAAPLAAQGGRNGTEINNVPYDGRFIYARIRYEAGGGGGFRRFDPMWNHDYPRSDRTFPMILQELSTVRARTDASNVFTADDPKLHRFPVVYLCEAGAWNPTEKEVLGLRSYMLKGGFVIFDDFDGDAWYNFEAQLKRVLPDARPLPLPPSHPIYDSFYRITDLTFGARQQFNQPQFYAVFEDNDPTRRIMAIINYNFDLSEFWEWSATGAFGIAPTNEAFKLGINYVMYTLTH